MAKRYIRINWQDAPSTATPRNAEFLNKMDKGIKDNDDAIGDLALLKTTAKTDLVAAINEQNDNLAQYMTTRSAAGITDVNDLTTTGIYGISTSASTTFLNMPIGRKGVLIVFKGSYIVHMYIDYTNVLYTRIYDGAVWTAWAIK